MRSLATPRADLRRAEKRSTPPRPLGVASAAALAAPLVLLGLLLSPGLLAAQDDAPAVDRERLDALYGEIEQGVEDRRDLTADMVDKIFSFSELGQQEFATSRYLVDLLREHGFEVEEGISGIPAAWWATWGSGEPVIALGSDIDGIPKSNQRPGVAYRDPLVEGAPGHGEGHNAGQGLNVTAALALKDVMEREDIEGTLVLWPGVAEEQLGSKAWYARDGWFDDVDAVLFTHVSSNMSVRWGGGRGTGLVSAVFSFEGEAAHGAGAPWRGRSALDAVSLMEVGWNFRREHLHPDQRSHSVITDGGDQPNVVPEEASIWYFVREMDYEGIRENHEKAIRTARGAALMTDTEMEHRVIGAAWPRHFNRPIAAAMHEHIEAVGLPEWSEDDQALARAVQEMRDDEDTDGLATEMDTLEGPPDRPRSGGSDDIGDVSWAVPTVTLRFPSNIPGGPGHHWSEAIAMATPIAHKGATAGAKVLARTALELYLRSEVVEEAWTYYDEVQTEEQEYRPLIGEDDPPPTDLNREIMEEYRSDLEQFYYDEERYDSYLEQLGVDYPQLEPPAEAGSRADESDAAAGDGSGR